MTYPDTPHKIYRLLAVCMASVSLAACSKPAEQAPCLMVTIEPLRYFTEQLTDTLWTVATLVPTGASPENYDPTPQQMSQLSESRAYLAAGHLGFENVWLQRLRDTHPRVRFFNLSEHIQLIAGEEETGHHHHHHGIDPHTWSSPRQARQIVQNIHQALLQIDAEHQAAYDERLSVLLAKIDSIDKQVADLLARAPSKAFIIYHPALTYLARDYGLTQYAIENEGKEPSPEQLKQLVDVVRREHIRTVFIQQEFDRRNAEIIVRETGCRLESINPLAYDWAAETLRIAKLLSDE